jgi:hypothetical protein
MQEEIAVNTNGYVNPKGIALRSLVDLRDRQVQKARIQFSNRLSTIERGADHVVQDGQAVVLLERYERAFAELEDQITKDIERLAKETPACLLLMTVPGIGAGLAAKIVALIGDIGRFATVSKLWRYAGYACIDGKRETLVRGEPAHFNKRLKSAAYLAGISFLRSGSPYSDAYYRFRERYDAQRPEWTPGHRHAAAMRKMIKLFLSHLWEEWRLLEGLPIRRTYVIDYLGHTAIEQPSSYGWDRSKVEKAMKRIEKRKEKEIAHVS